MKPEKILLHLETHVPGSPVLRILGVQHGVAGIFHMAPFDQRYVHDTLKRHPSNVLAEGLTETLVVPPIHQPRRLEPSWVKDLPSIQRVYDALQNHYGLQTLSWKPFSFSRLTQNAGSLVRRAASHLLLPLFARRYAEIMTEPLTEQQDFDIFLNSVRNTGIMVSDFTVADKPRSLFMAANALNSVLGSDRETLAVVGLAHASAIHRFTQNPRIALDYITELRQKIKENPQYYEGITPERLQDAEDVFRRHPVLNVGKTLRKSG